MKEWATEDWPWRKSVVFNKQRQEKGQENTMCVLKTYNILILLNKGLVYPGAVRTTDPTSQDYALGSITCKGM